MCKLWSFFHSLFYLNAWILIVTLYNSRGTCALQNGKSTFWHITDIHVDQNYSTMGDPSNLCHENPDKNRSEENGIYGNFLCDSPPMLVNITISAMRKIESNPDFIIWTGDNLPHTWKSNPDWDTVNEAIKNVTTLLRDTFPNISIFPSIGNHDTFPPNILLPEYHTDNIYTNYLERGGWKMILPEDAWSTFQKGGFYSLPISPSLRIVSLNTILWYEPNTFTANMTDPAGQLQWLEQQLQNASDMHVKVYIIGHVPPGFYNRPATGNISSPTYHGQYLKHYLNIIEKYYNIIAGQMFGHLHMDTFQLYQFNKGINHSSALLASSVTPWHYKKESDRNDTGSLPVNPSIRLMHFNATDGALMDYEQYFLNLSQANEMGSNHIQNQTLEPEFRLLYTFSKDYGLPDVSTSSLNALYEKLKSSEEIFQTFYQHSTAGKYSVPCGLECKRAQLCAIAAVSEEEYFTCMPNPGNSTSPPPAVTTMVPRHGKNPGHSSATIYAIIGSILFLLIVTFIIAVFRLRKRVRRSQSQYQRFPDF